MGNYLKGLVTYNEPPVAKTHFTTIVLGLNIIQAQLTYLPQTFSVLVYDWNEID
jgi:hypothetical protein